MKTEVLSKKKSKGKMSKKYRESRSPEQKAAYNARGKEYYKNLTPEKREEYAKRAKAKYEESKIA